MLSVSSIKVLFSYLSLEKISKNQHCLQHLKKIFALSHQNILFSCSSWLCSVHRQKQNKIGINVIKNDWNISPFKCWIQNQIVTLRSGFSYNQKSISNSKENPWLERNSLWSVIFQILRFHDWKHSKIPRSLSLWRRPRMTSTTNSEAVTRLQKDSHFGIQCISIEKS